MNQQPTTCNATPQTLPLTPTPQGTTTHKETTRNNKHPQATRMTHHINAAENKTSNNSNTKQYTVALNTTLQQQTQNKYRNVRHTSETHQHHATQVYKHQLQTHTHTHTHITVFHDNAAPAKQEAIYSDIVQIQTHIATRSATHKQSKRPL